jgi:hypothetical protein
MIRCDVMVCLIIRRRLGLACLICLCWKRKYRMGNTGGGGGPLHGVINFSKC